LNPPTVNSSIQTDPLIICAAIIGAKPDRGINPARPIYPDEIVDSAVEAWRAGAAILHLHARDSDGSPTNCVDAYRSMASKIRSSGCDAIFNFSSGDNGGRSPHPERLKVVAAGSEIVSLSGGSFNSGKRLYDNSPQYQRELARLMQGAGVKPEVEIFDTGQLQALRVLIDEGLVSMPCMVTLVFGVPGGLETDVELLRWMVGRLPVGCHWTICCQTESASVYTEMQVSALALGGHVRTGLEDFSWTTDGSLAQSNAALVAEWASHAQSVGRTISSASEARKILGLAELPIDQTHGNRA
jgi:3-keto-5-aminohexanoate cleavage enzyme